MRSLAVRFALLGLFVVACGASTYLFWMGEVRGRETSRAAQAFEQRAFLASRDLMDLRAAQQAYLAVGQGIEFWSTRVAAAAAGLKETLGSLRASATSSRAQEAIDNASSSLQDFEQMDGRARQNVHNGQKQAASELIFRDGFDMTTAAIASLDQARAAELDAYDQAAAIVRQRQLFATGAAAAAALLVIALLVPGTGRPEPEVISVVPKPQEPKEPPRPAGLHTGDEGWTYARRASDPLMTKASSIDVSSIAALCTDLGRVADTRSLPGLLERAAIVLDASGIVLWIADSDGRELNPYVTHGYFPPVVVRLGTISRDAQNATAAAFRTSLVQTVKADPMSNGAIAAPLVTPAGAVGVMAAEVRHGGEQDEEKLAAATIVAAQLATLVDSPATLQAKAGAAGA